MKSLFLRIFLWFWLVMAVVVGLLVVLSPAWTRVRPAFAQWEQRTFARLAREAEHVARLLQDEGLEALREDPELYGGGPRPKVFVLDDAGNDLFGQDIPEEVRELAAQARTGGEVEPVRHGLDFLVARPVTDAAGNREVIVIGAGPSRHGRRQGPPRPIELIEPNALLPILALIVLVVGALSFWLARYLTSSVGALRAATVRLSRGDLSTRVGASVSRRRDEIGGLARDFDAMAQRLEALVGSQRRLLRDVSHELRSPLARLRVALELTRRGASVEVVQHLDRIEREAERLDAMIEQLLTLERLQAGGPITKTTMLDLRALLEEVVTDAEFEAHTRGCSVRLLPGPACHVSGSAELLRSALENVIRNAVSYTDDGTTVEVSLSCEGRDGSRTAAVLVRDHGPGVPEKDVAHLFEPFYRVAAARDRQSGGTGLGLAITDRAVRLHGGSADARNHPEGGLEVRLTMPLEDAEEELASR